MSPLRTWRVGLRNTITVAFAVGGTALSAVFGIGTYLVARDYLVEQRERTGTRQAFADAAYVRDGLLTTGVEVSDVLGSVSPPADATVLIRRDDDWFSSSLDIGGDALPDRLKSTVRQGTAGVTWREAPDGPTLAVGIPLPAVGAEFYEITSTSELARTLDTLRAVLGAFAVVTALAGGVLGRWAARRVLTPLDEVAGAAARIAAGARDTRLPTTEDPDLATIVGSFNSMVDAVHERIERDARFAADVSHELRTPLTALVTSVEVLQRRRHELTERSRQALDLIDRDLHRFQRALEDLLELGRLESGAAGSVLTTVDLPDLVRHALESSGRQADLLTVNARAGDTQVTVDKARISRALVNLFENADRHGGGLTAVSVSASDSYVEVAVDDEGPGVPSADRDRIFDRFVRGGSRGSLPGTGLGLSLVAETVRAHDGHTWCSSRPHGPGARFFIRLPAAGSPRDAP